MSIRKRIFISILLLGIVLHTSLVQGALGEKEKKQTIALEECLLPTDHPLQKKLSKLFKYPVMFNSSSQFRAAGFDVNPRVHLGLMVAKHPSIKKYVIKKYQNNVLQKLQLEKYLKRIAGALILKKYIKEHNYKHLVVPDKWIYELPSAFSMRGVKSYVLIAEEMDLCAGADDPNSENGRNYYQMTEKVFIELCTLMHDLGGCDAYPRNQTFTKSGKIAFIDTEDVGNKKSHFPQNIIPLLNEDLKDQAQSIWDQLEYEEQLRLIMDKD